jgi:hypothetical protein
MGEKITLTEAIKQHAGKPDAFPLNKPLYNHRGDCIAIYFSDTEMYSEIVDEMLTIYRSFENEVVGCKLCNISVLAENVESIVHVDDDDVQLRLLLLSAAGTKPARKYYYDVSRRVGDLRIKKNELVHAMA